MISWRMAAAWVVALVLTTVLTWQIVGLADSQVGETPVAVAPSLVTSSWVDTTTTTSPTSSTTTVSTTTTPGGDTTSSSASADSSSASTSSSTSSTAAAAEWTVRTINSVGGSVVVRHRPGEVELQAATPAPGFAVEIDDDGPERVRVEFDSGNVEVRVEVRWESGSLDVDVDEHD